MSNKYRGRWDALSNPKSVKEYAVLAADAIEIGDLVWFDKRTASVKSFSHTDAWTGSTDGSQGKVANNFVGVARSAHAATDSANLTVRVEAKGVFAFVVTTAAIFHVGDLVTASKDASGNLLHAQQVDRGANDPALYAEHTARARELAIGKVARSYAVASSIVEVEILGQREPGGSPKMYLTS